MTPDFEDPPEVVLVTMPNRQILRPWDVCWRRVPTVPHQNPTQPLALYCDRCYRGQLAHLVKTAKLEHAPMPPLVRLPCFGIRFDPDCEYLYWLGQCPRCLTGYWAWREKDS
jgi:hypothetical protein